MRVEKIICDCCKEEIPKVKRKNAFGIEREYYIFGHLDYGKPFTDIDGRKIGIDICEKCAAKISIEIYKARINMILNSSD